jgi:hypothetical protein
MGGPAARYITNLIQNNQHLFSQVLSQLIQTDINNYFSQTISTLIQTNSNTFFSQSISNLITNYKSDFLTALNPSYVLTGPVTITDFTQSAYFTPIYENHWNISYPGGGAVRFATNVGTQDNNWGRTLCGLAFRPFLFVDPTSKHLTVRITIQDMSNGNPTTPASTHRHLIGIVWTAQDKLHSYGIGRNGATSSSVTGSGGSITSDVPSNAQSVSGITSDLVGSTWEVKIDVYDVGVATNGRKIEGYVRVGGGAWTQITSVTASQNYEPHANIFGFKIGICGFSIGSIYPTFGGTVVQMDIDSGLAVM